MFNNLSLCSLPSLSPAFFISPSGSDNSTGSQSAPFATIAKAQAAMRNSTVKTTYIRSGAYSIVSLISLDTADNNTTFMAYPGEQPIISTSLANAIYASNVSGLTISGLTFTGATATTDKLFLELHGCTLARIIANKFISNNGGLLLAGTTTSTISGNQFDNHGFCAIELKDGSDHNVIDSNKITGVNNTSAPTTGGGIYGHGVNYNTISHNEITNCQGSGISISNFDGPTQPIYTINVGNDVLYNILRNCCSKADDSGAIYTVGRAQINTKMRIMNNLVDGVHSSVANPHALGIYLDDEANGVLVQDNIVRNIAGSNIGQFHAGQNCTMRNNIFDFSSGSQGLLFQEATYAGSTQTPGPNYVTQNIFWTSQSSLTPYVDLNGGTRTISSNLYPVGTTLANPNLDTTPIYGSPAFANPSALDYSFGASSVANTIGFIPIDQSSMGLRPMTAHFY